MLIGLFSSFFASLFFSIIFNIAKKNLPYCGLIGMIGWGAYLLVIDSGREPLLATFVGSISITIVAYTFAVYKKTPATVFLVPGIIPLVPGFPLYQTIYYYTQKDYTRSLHSGFDTISAALSIAIAVIIISALYRFVSGSIKQ